MLTDKNIPDTSFYVKAVKKPKKGTLAKQSVVMYVPDGVKFPAEGGGGSADLRVFEYTDYNPTGQAPTKTVLTFLTEQGVDDGEWFVIKGAQTGQHIGSEYAFKITDTSDSQRYDWGGCFTIDNNLGGPLYASSNHNFVGCFKYEWSNGSSSQTWSLNVIGSGGVSCNATIDKTVRNGQFSVYEVWYPLTVDTITYSSSFDPMGIGSDRVMDAPSIAKIKGMFQTIYSSAFPTKCIVPKTVSDFSSAGGQINYIDFWYFDDWCFQSTSTPFDNNLINNPDSTPYIQDYSALQDGEQILVWIDDAYGLPYILGAQTFEGETLALRDANGNTVDINLPQDKYQMADLHVGRWYILSKSDGKYWWASWWEDDGQYLTKNVNKFW